MQQETIYDVFISYRVKTDRFFAEKLFLALRWFQIKTFLDKYCLKTGEPWENGFMNGLQRSKVIVLCISDQMLEGIKHAGSSKGDSVLKEIEAALDFRDNGSKKIFPILLGEFDFNADSFKKFNNFNAYEFPDEPHVTGKNIRATMTELFASQGEHINPEDVIDSILPKIKDVVDSVGLPHLYFDGSSSYLTVDDNSKLNFSGYITMMGWMYSENFNGFRYILGIFNGKEENYLRVLNGELQGGSWGSTTGDSKTQTKLMAADLKCWVHVCVVFDKQVWILYKGGKEVFRTQARIGANNVNSQWTIGAGINGTERYFKGYLKDVGIWSSALPVETIQNYMRGQGNYNEPSLVGFWRLNDGRGEIANDTSPNKINAIIKECVWQDIKRK